jgi:hypothetical protein
MGLLPKPIGTFVRDVRTAFQPRGRLKPFAATTLLLLTWATSLCIAQNQPAQTPADIFRRVRPSVVLIVGSESGDKIAQGSGFIVAENRVVTNYHVIAGLSEAYVLFADGHSEPVAGVVTADADQDTALLNVQTNARPLLALGDELNLREGDSILAIGAPRGLELSLSSGIVSAFRNSEGKFLIQNTAPIAPGSSGGPLLDSHGRVVGVTTSLLVDTPGVYFSIGAGAVKRLLKAPPTMSQTFASWAASKGAKPLPNLSETFEWIKSKVETKAGGTFHYQNYFPDPSEVGQEQHYELELHQSDDKCVFLFRFKRKIVTQSVRNSLMGDKFSECVTTSEDQYSEILPIYYLKEAKFYTYSEGVPVVELKFDGKKHTMHWQGESHRTGCRDTSLSVSSSSQPEDMRDDFLIIQFLRYPAEDNGDLAKRVADAFNHAARLCASQRPNSKEPF